MPNGLDGHGRWSEVARQMLEEHDHLGRVANEGYPHMQGGLEYLFGATYLDAQGERQFIDWWAHDREQERKVFEDFVDWVHDRWTRDRSMHIYHYAAYEVSAVGRSLN